MYLYIYAVQDQIHHVQATGAAGSCSQHALKIHGVLLLLQITLRNFLDSASTVLIKAALPLLLQIQSKWNYKRYPLGYLYKP